MNALKANAVINFAPVKRMPNVSQLFRTAKRNVLMTLLAIPIALPKRETEMPLIYGVASSKTTA